MEESESLFIVDFKIFKLSVSRKTPGGSEFYSLDILGTKVRLNRDFLTARSSTVNATVWPVSLGSLMSRGIKQLQLS